MLVKLAFVLLAAGIYAWLFRAAFKRHHTKAHEAAQRLQQQKKEKAHEWLRRL